ncbi:MAG: hypothetical protein QNJ97_00570 [Myxococcota bacterium]|nr:hypothetical protein [Myxococcota bacterium]
MMKHHTRAIGFYLVSTLIGVWIALIPACGAKFTPTTSTETRAESDSAFLEQLDLAFCRETTQKGVSGWVAYFAPNGAMVSGDNPPVVGHDAIREAMTPLFEKQGFSLTWQPTGSGIWIPDRLGYTVGRFVRISMDSDGRMIERQGTYLTIWNKQKDSTWKILFDTGEPDALQKGAAR